MASAELSRRVGKVVAYPPLSEMSEQQRREFQEALLDANTFEDLAGKWQAAILLSVTAMAAGELRPRAIVESHRHNRLPSTLGIASARGT